VKRIGGGHGSDLNTYETMPFRLGSGSVSYMTPPVKQRSETVTDAIERAAFDELAERGYARMSIDQVARRAGVGKAAIYRRHASKEALVLVLVERAAAGDDGYGDTGTLRGDVLAWLRHGGTTAMFPRAAEILPDLIAESAREPAFGERVFALVGAPRRRRSRAVFERAIARGELPPGVDLELAADFMAGPLFWRTAVTRQPQSEADLGRLADAIVAAIASTAPA
jgi:AcrR family transcriptional regulator